MKYIVFKNLMKSGGYLTKWQKTGRFVLTHRMMSHTVTIRKDFVERFIREEGKVDFKNVDGNEHYLAVRNFKHDGYTTVDYKEIYK